jgi:guanine deaminase
VSRNADPQFVERTIEIVHENVEDGGRPFSCIVVRNGEVLAESPNLVAQTNNSVAHAETVAIEQACKRVGSEDLSGCDVYVMARPCPRCLSALYYCSPDHVFFCTQREEYERYYTDSRKYFEFGEFYDEYRKDWDERNLPLIHAGEADDDALSIYERWQALNGN